MLSSFLVIIYLLPVGLSLSPLKIIEDNLSSSVYLGIDLKRNGKEVGETEDMKVTEY